MPITTQHPHPGETCPTNDWGHYHDYEEYLIVAAPDVLWYDVQVCGDYQGKVYAVGRRAGKIVLWFGYYGSCGGCGAWDEGGQPEDINDAVEFATAHEAKEFVLGNRDWSDGWDKPDMVKLFKAVEEAEAGI